MKLRREESQPYALQQAILEVIRYFSYFSYAPSLEEIFVFLPKKTRATHVKKACDLLVNSESIELLQDKKPRSHTDNTLPQYTIRGEGISARQVQARKLATSSKIARLKTFFNIVYFFPEIRLIGISGSCAMANARPKDDIDIFLISAPHRLWTARFITLCIAQLFGLRRKRNEKRVKNKVCINLLFDGNNITVPQYKRNLYTAHEVVQMLPIIMGEGAYRKWLLTKAKCNIKSMEWKNTATKNKSLRSYFTFISKNKWAGEYFPNISTSIHIPHRKERRTRIGDIIEAILRNIQMFIITRHKTDEIVTRTQLWFFPHDFEKRLRMDGVIQDERFPATTTQSHTHYSRLQK